MTGQSAGPVRLLLRAPPHLPFVQGYPGIPPGGNRPNATVQGTVEVRTAGVKAKWVRVEIRKHESVPGAIVGKSSGLSSTVHVGSPHVLWKPPEGKEFDQLGTADFRFVMPFPGESPPSVELKGCKITYELIAAVCYKGKGGLFKKDSSSIATVTEPLRITKYELASAWPTYNQLEQRTASALNGAVTLVVDRPIQAFGPGDRIVVTATIKSEAQNHFRLKGFEMALVEVLTVFPPKPDASSKKKNKPPSPPTIKRNPVCNTRVVADGQVVPGGERGARLDLVVPTDRSLLTVRGAKEFQVDYELVVEAACDGGPSKVLLGGLACTIGTFPRSSAQQAVRDIGFVQGLCPRPQPGVGHQPSPSLPGSVSGSSKGGSHDTGLAPTNAVTPPRGHQASMSADGFLTTEPGFYRPLSMNLPPLPGTFSTPSPPPPMSNMQHPAFLQHPPHPQQPPQSYPFNQPAPGPTAFPQAQPNFQQRPESYQPQSPYQQQPNPYQQPQRPTTMQGFVPRDKWRRSSSGTTTTTATTATGLTDHGPITDRNVATMPVQRGSYGFPAPNTGRTSDAAFGPTFEELETHDSQATVRVSQSDAGHSHRRSSPVTGTFGNWNNHHSLLDRVTNSSSPTTTMTDDTSLMHHTPTRPESSNTTPTRATGAMAGGWTSAANEKQRLYEDARNRAANTQAAHGVGLSNIGMDAGPSGAPPEYTPPPAAKPATPVHIVQPQSPIHDSPQSVRLFGASDSANPASGGRIDSGPGGSLNGSAIPQPQFAPPAHVLTPPLQSPQVLTPPLPVPQLIAEPPSDEPIPYEHLFGPSSTPAASSSKPVVPLSPRLTPQPYMSAAQEKDAMRARYEAATSAVNRAAAGSANGSAAPSAIDSNVNLGGGSISGHSPAQSISGRNSPPVISQQFMSAADEKDMMRRRYEEARARVASDSPGGSVAGSSSMMGGGPSGPSQTSPQSSVPVAYMTAAQEKDMMRKRFEEATSAVNRAAGSSAAPSGSGFSGPSRSESGSGPSQTSSLTMPKAYMSAADEKDMMRHRYEEATGAVTRAAGGSSDGRSVSGSGPRPAGSPSNVSPSTPTAYMSAAEEKDMMRRRFEDAQGRVAAAASGSFAQQSPTSPAIQQQRPTSPPSAYPASASSSSRAPPTQYMSAEQEKDAMRRRYENATQAVARAAGVGDSPGAGSSSSFTAAPASSFAAAPPPGDQPIPYDELFGPGPSAGSSSQPPAPTPAHMSAAEEKDMMRRRYEEATSAVNRAASGGGPSSAVRTSPTTSPSSKATSSFASPAYTTPPSTSASTFMSATDEKDLMRQRYEEASSALNRAVPSSTSPSSLSQARGSVYGHGHPGQHQRSASLAYPGESARGPGVGPQRQMTRKERMMSALPDGPPPPLAARPPQEYIDRLERQRQ